MLMYRTGTLDCDVRYHARAGIIMLRGPAGSDHFAGADQQEESRRQAAPGHKGRVPADSIALLEQVWYKETSSKTKPVKCYIDGYMRQALDIKTFQDLRGIGGALCLDLSNTVDWRGSAAEIDRLASYADFLAWTRCFEIMRPVTSPSSCTKREVAPKMHCVHYTGSGPSAKRSIGSARASQPLPPRHRMTPSMW